MPSRRLFCMSPQATGDLAVIPISYLASCGAPISYGYISGIPTSSRVCRVRLRLVGPFPAENVRSSLECGPQSSYDGRGIGIASFCQCSWRCDLWGSLVGGAALESWSPPRSTRIGVVTTEPISSVSASLVEVQVYFPTTSRFLRIWSCMRTSSPCSWNDIEGKLLLVGASL